MRNRELFKQKLTRIDGKLKSIRVMATRQGTTVQDLDKILDSIYEELNRSRYYDRKRRKRRLRKII